MKKNLLIGAMLVAFIGVFSACSRDEKCNNELLGTWKLQDLVKGEDDTLLDGGFFIRAEGEEASVQTVESFSGMGNLFMANVLQSVNFKANKKLIARYGDVKLNSFEDVMKLIFSGKTTEWLTSDEDMVAYDAGKSTISLQLNADKIIEAAGIEDAEAKVKLKKALGQSLDVKYRIIKSNTLECYLDKPMILDYVAILKSNVEEESEQLNSLIDNLDKLTSLELGLKFTR